MKKWILFFLIGMAATMGLMWAAGKVYAKKSRLAQKENEALQSYSQYKQDMYVNEHFFKNKRNGVFVDIGASDGKAINNTYGFERHLGWSGLCIEPRPEQFEQLVKNRTCVCINGGIAAQSGSRDFLLLKGYTGDLSGFTDRYDPRHIDRIKAELSALGGSSEIVKVPCYRLMDLLAQHNISHVDYLSVDTEGSELEILSSIDFNNVEIDVIDVEDNYGDTKIAELLQQQGYEFVTRIECDEIYKRKMYT